MLTGASPGHSLTLGEGGEYSHTLGTSTTFILATKQAGIAETGINGENMNLKKEIRDA